MESIPVTGMTWWAWLAIAVGVLGLIVTPAMIYRARRQIRRNPAPALLRKADRRALIAFWAILALAVVALLGNISVTMPNRTMPAGEAPGWIVHTSTTTSSVERLPIVVREGHKNGGSRITRVDASVNTADHHRIFVDENAVIDPGSTIRYACGASYLYWVAEPVDRCFEASQLVALDVSYDHLWWTTLLMVLTFLVNFLNVLAFNEFYPKTSKSNGSDRKTTVSA